MNNLNINKIMNSYSERDKILPQLNQIKGEPEMTESQSAFLCGLLLSYKPHKIVEVGIAGGGSTAIILQCLNGIEYDQEIEFHSVDYSEHFYRNKKFVSGFLGMEADALLKNERINHKYHLGNVACSFINEIGNDVDFLILDTVHSLPGEVLDFLTLLPILKDGCVVVLHDVSLNLLGRNRSSSATGTLFASVSGQKFINYDEKRDGMYPNIGAFIVDKDTRESIANVFLALLLSWTCFPNEEQLAEYTKSIENNYSEELVGLFKRILLLQEQSLKKTKQWYLRIREIVRIIIKGLR